VSSRLKVPILIFDSESFRVVEVNQATAELYGRSAEAMVGSHVSEFVAGGEHERLRSVLAREDAEWGDAGLWRCVAGDGRRFVARLRFHQTLREERLVHMVLATEIVKRPPIAAGAASRLPKAA
jgi:PAS domain S-box-containing protein